MLRKQLFIRYGLAGLWMLAIFLFSHQPAGSSDKQSDFFVSLLEPVSPVVDTDLLTFLTRKSAHFILYFVLGILMYNAVRLHAPSRKAAVLISIGAVLAFATSDEIHQLFVPGRSGEVRDVLLDTTAGTTGVGLFATIEHSFKRRTKLTK